MQHGDCVPAELAEAPIPGMPDVSRGDDVMHCMFHALFKASPSAAQVCVMTHCVWISVIDTAAPKH